MQGSPGQYKGQKCLTRLCKRYGAMPGYQLDENLTLTSEWEQVKEVIKRPPKGDAFAWSQILREGDPVNLFLARTHRGDDATHSW